MTQDEIIWLWDGVRKYARPEDRLQEFASLVARHEREACVKAIEEQIAWDLDDPESTAIKAIRARGQA
jgi:hypothetical protein